MKKRTLPFVFLFFIMHMHVHQIIMASTTPATTNANNSQTSAIQQKQAQAIAIIFPASMPTQSMHEAIIDSIYGSSGINIAAIDLTHIKKTYCYLEFLIKIDKIKNNKEFSQYTNDFKDFLQPRVDNTPLMPTQSLVNSNSWKAIQITPQDIINSPAWQNFVKAMICDSLDNDALFLVDITATQDQVFPYIPNIETAYATNDFTKLRLYAESIQLQALIQSEQRNRYLAQSTDWNNIGPDKILDAVTTFKATDFYNYTHNSQALQPTKNSKTGITNPIVIPSPTREQLLCYFMLVHIQTTIHDLFTQTNTQAVLTQINSHQLSPNFFFYIPSDFIYLNDLFTLQKLSDKNKITPQTSSIAMNGVPGGSNSLAAPTSGNNVKIQMQQDEVIIQDWISDARKALDPKKNGLNKIIAQANGTAKNVVNTLTSKDGLKNSIDKATQIAGNIVKDIKNNDTGDLLKTINNGTSDILKDYSINVNVGAELDKYIQKPLMTGMLAIMSGMEKMTDAFTAGLIEMSVGLTWLGASIGQACGAKINPQQEADKVRAKMEKYRSTINIVMSVVITILITVAIIVCTAGIGAAGAAALDAGMFGAEAAATGAEAAAVAAASASTIADASVVTTTAAEMAVQATGNATEIILTTAARQAAEKAAESAAKVALQATAKATARQAAITATKDLGARQAEELTAKTLVKQTANAAAKQGATTAEKQAAQQASEQLVQATAKKETANLAAKTATQQATDATAQLATEQATATADKTAAKIALEKTQPSTFTKITTALGRTTTTTAADASQATVLETTENPMLAGQSLATNATSSADSTAGQITTKTTAQQFANRAALEQAQGIVAKEEGFINAVKGGVMTWSFVIGQALNAGFGVFSAMAAANEDENAADKLEQERKSIQALWRFVEDSKINLTQNQQAFLDELNKKHQVSVENQAFGLQYYKNFLNSSINNVQDQIAQALAQEYIQLLTPDSNGLRAADIGSTWGLQTQFDYLYPSQGFISTTLGRPDFPYAQEVAQAPLASETSSSNTSVNFTDNQSQAAKLWFNQRAMSVIHQAVDVPLNVEIKFRIIYKLTTAYHVGLYLGGNYYDYNSASYLQSIQDKGSIDIDEAHLAKMFILKRDDKDSVPSFGVYENEGKGWITQEPVDANMLNTASVYHMSANLNKDQLTVSFWPENNPSAKWNKTTTVTPCDQRSFGVIFSGLAIEWDVVQPHTTIIENTQSRVASNGQSELDRERASKTQWQQLLKPQFGSMVIQASSKPALLQGQYLYTTQSNSLLDSKGNPMTDYIVFATSSAGRVSNIGTSPAPSNASLTPNVILSLITGNVYNNSGQIVSHQQNALQIYSQNNNAIPQSLNDIIVQSNQKYQQNQTTQVTQTTEQASVIPSQTLSLSDLLNTAPPVTGGIQIGLTSASPSKIVATKATLSQLQTIAAGTASIQISDIGSVGLSFGS